MNRSCLCSILITTALICGAYFIGNAYIDKEFKEVQISLVFHIMYALYMFYEDKSILSIFSYICKEHCSRHMV